MNRKNIAAFLLIIMIIAIGYSKDGLSQTSSSGSKLISDVEILVSISEIGIVTTAVFDYQFKNKTLEWVQIEVPKGHEVIEVIGDGVKSWKQKDGVLTVEFEGDVKDFCQIEMVLESLTGFGKGEMVLPQIKTIGAERERGFIAVEAASLIELQDVTAHKVFPIDPSKLPGTLTGSPENQIVLAYKYIKLPFNVSFTVKQHKKLSTLNSTIDSANYVTVLTKGGKSVTRAVFLVRNNGKHYLKLEMPENAVVWNVFIDDQPIDAAMDEDGKVLVPLGTDADTSFRVELTYYTPLEKLEKTGNIKSIYPKVDLPVSEILLTMYLPSNFEYKKFEGGLEKIDRILDTELTNISSKNGPASPGRVRNFVKNFNDKEQKTNSALAIRAQAEIENEIAAQLKNTGYASSPIDDRGNVSGFVSPANFSVKFSVPLRGSVFRFSKLLVVDESPDVSFSYKEKRETFVTTNISAISTTVFIMLFVGLLLAAVVYIKNNPIKTDKNKPDNTKSTNTPPPLNTTNNMHPETTS